MGFALETLIEKMCGREPYRSDYLWIIVTKSEWLEKLSALFFARLDYGAYHNSICHIRFGDDKLHVTVYPYY